MADTSIEWTDRVWNPVRGCSIVSPGCTNCYAMKQAHRFSNPGGPYEGLTKLTKGGPVWTDKVRLVPEALGDPLRWRKPVRVFVNSMSDLFHEDVPDDFIVNVFTVMAIAKQHTFQVLTKRADRMRRLLATMRADDLYTYWHGYSGAPAEAEAWPLPNVWLGVSVEDQKRADERIPLLLQTPAAVRWISAEPLLGAVDLSQWVEPCECVRCCSGEHRGSCKECAGWASNNEEETCSHCDGTGVCPLCNGAPQHTLDWVVAGGESGPGARPIHPDWPRSLRDQCASAGVPFFFKQWGAWAPGECGPQPMKRTERVATYWAEKWDYYTLTPTESINTHSDDGPDVHRFGKKAAGRKLDGRTHDEYPA